MSIITIEKEPYLQNDFVIGKNGYSVATYLYGKCNNFTIILSKTLGLKAGGLFTEDAIKENPLSLTHAYCILNEDYVIDAAGIRKIEDIKEEYGHLEDLDIEYRDCLELLILETNSGNYAGFNDAFHANERLSLRSHINKYFKPMVENFYRDFSN